MQAKHLLLPLLVSGLCGITAKADAQTTSPDYFLENKGQVTNQHGTPRSDIDYRIGSGAVNLFTGTGKLLYQWASPIEDEDRTALYRMDVTLLGANPNSKPVSEEQLAYREQYYLPQCASGTIAHSYQKITYPNIYPHIDWVLYVKNGSVEYDFVVHPGGRVSDIQLRYEGATQLSLDHSGQLVATTPMGKVKEAAPVSYQQDGRQISSSFVLNGDVLSFKTEAYSGTLIIDPTLSWATYYGDLSTETIRNGCVSGDRFGNGYFSGTTGSSANIASTGSYMDTIAGSTDAFLAKFNETGTRIWATYFGGSASDNSYSSSCDSMGNVYLSGYTQSTSGIASSGAYQTVQAGSTDAFLAQFDSSGSLQWATYFGGSGTEQCYGVTCDRSNNVYISGYTQSSADIASSGAHQSVYGGANDAFLAKFNSTGSLQWSTYYGGSLQDYGQSVACDTDKNVYLCGYTRSTTDIATSGAFRSSWNASDDAYLVKFDSTGVRQWGTYYGGAILDRGLSVCTDLQNNVYMAGATTSDTGIATSGSAQDTFGGGSSADAYLVKFNSAGARQWATYYGTSSIDDAGWVCANKWGYLYLFGRTASASGIATAGAWKDSLDGTSDAMLIKFDTAGVKQWATYFGGEATEIAYGVYCNEQSQVFIGGQTTSSSGLATSGAFQTSYGGSNDGYFAVFNDCNLSDPDSISGNDTVCSGSIYTYAVPAVSGAISYTWTLPAGWTGSSSSDSIQVTTGTASDTIRVTANFPCGSSSTIEKLVYVSPLPLISPSGTIDLCEGDSLTLNSSSGTTYQWYESGTAISGTDAATYTVHNSGHYTVVVSNPLSACVDTSLTDTIIVHPLPVPVITATGTLLSTGTYGSYQWNHNGTPITGATSNTFTISVLSGLYTVTVTDGNGCEGISAPVDGSTVGIENPNLPLSFSVYPNPVQDKLYIQSDEPLNVTLLSIEGKVLTQLVQVKVINMESYAAGMYLLRLTDKQGRFIGTQKIIKHNSR